MDHDDTPVPKVLGLDFELSNYIEIPGQTDGLGRDASRLLLRQIRGCPAHAANRSEIELDRIFLREQGGSTYIDSEHLENNLPEHLRAAIHGVLLFAMLRLTETARREANKLLSPGARISVLANCGDGSNSTGSHLNVMIHDRLFHDLLHMRRPHLAGFWATHLVTSIPFTGQGQVGAGNSREACDYQFHQRADWFEEFAGVQTTQKRPLINLRAEHHAEIACRLHCIFFDNVLCPHANLLKAGTSQLVLAMMEAGWIDPSIQLDDPLAAASEISRDLTLSRRFPTVVRGRPMTAVEIQRAIYNLACEFVAAGMADGIVPDARKILEVWGLILDLLARREFGELARHLDAFLKLSLLQRHRARTGCGWDSASMKAIDLMYSSIDPSEGLFFKMAHAGVVADMPSDREITLALEEPPEDTRAYLRCMLIRRFSHAITRMDWSWIDFRIPQSRNWNLHARLRMPDPCGFDRQQSESLLACGSLEELVEAANGA